jgi:hypothetical protein
VLLRFIFALVLLSAGAGGVRAEGTDAPTPQKPLIVTQDASCASACQAEHDRCRLQTKGSPSCDAARQRCLQACLANKRR